VVAAALIAPQGAAAAERCSASGAKVVAENTTARVFYVRGKGELKRTYYGCLRGRKPTVLDRDLSPRSDQDTHTRNSDFKLSGRHVAWFSEAFSDFGAGEFGRAVNVRGLRKGDRSFSEAIEANPQALAVRDDGAAAWILGDDKPSGYREIDVVAGAARRAAPLAYARGIDTTAFGIDSDGVHWTQDGTLRTAKPAVAPAAPSFDAAAAGPQSLDPSYGRCGALKPLPATYRSSDAQAIARGADGSVAVAGVAGTRVTEDRIAVDKLTAAGLESPAWNGGAAVVAKPPLPAGAGSLEVSGVVVLPDGKVVVAAHYATTSPSVTRSLLTRFNADGSIDGGFGSGGYALDVLPARSAGQINDLVLQPDGALLAAATFNDTAEPFGDGERFTVARFTPAGKLDPSFAGDGIAMLDTSALGGAEANAVRVLADGRILVGGQAGEQFALARFAADGAADATFGTGGAVYDSPPAAAAISALEPLPDGRIVVAGSAAGVLGSNSLTLGRFSADGVADQSFGTDGFVIDPYALGAKALIVQPDGRLIVGGPAVVSAAGASGSGLVRLRADGSRDSGFGVGGALVGFTSYSIEVAGLVPGANGTVLAAERIAFDYAAVSYAVDEGATSAAAPAARACSVNIATKSLEQLLRGGKTAKYGKLRLSFFTLQPGALRLRATAATGGRTVTIGTATVTNGTYGTGVAEIAVSKKAAKALGLAKSAPITVVATGARGGADRTETKTLERKL
jgi:uncharacterized delta-60 repeat protein